MFNGIPPWIFYPFIKRNSFFHNNIEKDYDEFLNDLGVDFINIILNVIILFLIFWVIHLIFSPFITLISVLLVFAFLCYLFLLKIGVSPSG